MGAGSSQDADDDVENFEIRTNLPIHLEQMEDVVAAPEQPKTVRMANQILEMQQQTGQKKLTYLVTCVPYFSNELFCEGYASSSLESNNDIVIPSMLLSSLLTAWKESFRLVDYISTTFLSRTTGFASCEASCTMSKTFFREKAMYLIPEYIILNLTKPLQVTQWEWDTIKFTSSDCIVNGTFDGYPVKWTCNDKDENALELKYPNNIYLVHALSHVPQHAALLKKLPSCLQYVPGKFERSGIMCNDYSTLWTNFKFSSLDSVSYSLNGHVSIHVNNVQYYIIAVSRFELDGVILRIRQANFKFSYNGYVRALQSRNVKKKCRELMIAAGLRALSLTALNFMADVQVELMVLDLSDMEWIIKFENGARIKFDLVAMTGTLTHGDDIKLDIYGKLEENKLLKYIQQGTLVDVQFEFK